MAARPRGLVIEAPGGDGQQLLADGLSKFTPTTAGSLSSRYALGAVLGRGAYSVVRDAHCRATGERLAAKIVAKAQFAHLPAALRRLRDEARVLRALRHPHHRAARHRRKTRDSPLFFFFFEFYF